MKNNYLNQGQSLIGIIIVLVVVGLFAGGLYYYFSKQIPEMPEIPKKPSEEKVVKPKEKITPPPKEELPKEEIIPKEVVPPLEEVLPSKKEVVTPLCQNECSPSGLKRCSDNGYQVCGNYNEDICLEWGPLTVCPVNTICQNGNCTPKKCIDGTLYGQCSNNKPKYCDKGNLVDKCSICGCPTGQYCDEVFDLCKTTEKFDMLIFISPQYADDVQIKQAINRYIDAVKDDLGWMTKIITITPDINDFRKIDEIIEDYYFKSGGNLKACIMVGEDINTPLKAEFNKEEAPTTLPWMTTGKYEMIRKNESISCIGDVCEIKDKNTGKLIEKYNKKEGRVLDSGQVTTPTWSQKLEIVISLLYPTHELDYALKSQYLQSVFKKFSKDRRKVYPKESVVLTDDKDWIGKTKETLSQYSHLYFREKPNQNEVKKTLEGEYMLYWANGHAQPDFIAVSPTVEFPSFYLEGKEPVYTAGGGIKDFIYYPSLNTPIFVGEGCYTEGWWTNDFEGNDRLDFSINKEWFGSKIFTNIFLRAMILGGPGTLGEGQSFVDIALPDLMKGKTLAESLVGKSVRLGQIIIYGDPTFHYNF